MLIQEKYKKIFLFFLLTLLFKPLWLFNNSNLGQPADDMYHWIHAATIAYDKDINYVNDYSLETGTFNEVTNVPSAPPGAGYMSSPFVFLFNKIDNLNSDSELIRLNPTKSFGYLGFFFAGLFYSFWGLYFLNKILRNNSLRPFILIASFIGTFTHYVSTRFLMPHAAEFFLCSSILYILESKESKLSYKKNVILSVLYFLLLITRPSTFIYSLFLLLIYRSKFSFKDLKQNIFKMGLLLMFSFIYVSLSQDLYQENYMLLNTYGSDMDEYRSTFNFHQIYTGLLKIPNLFFSPSMGLLWTAPIVFIGVILFLKNTIIKYNNIDLTVLFTFLYLSASVAPLLIWQGREVAYGQRLLIGIIPFCALLTSRLFSVSKFSSLSLKISTLITYTGYLYFYSSPVLTLREGKTLWGTIVGFTGENYFYNVFSNLLDIETVLSVGLRNIYIVNFFKIINKNTLYELTSKFNFLDQEKIENFLSYVNIYSSLKGSYLLTVNFIIFTFCYLLVKVVANDFLKDKKV